MSDRMDRITPLKWVEVQSQHLSVLLHATCPCTGIEFEVWQGKSVTGMFITADGDRRISYPRDIDAAVAAADAWRRGRLKPLIEKEKHDGQ